VAEAGNYYEWIVDSFADSIGKRIIEVGAGIGTVAELVIRRAQPDDFLLVEPARNNIPALRRRFDGKRGIRIYEGYLEDLRASASADSVIAVNVLEHVERDYQFLKDAYTVLVPGGALLLLVPAVPAIYGSLDRAFEHHRRYTRAGLTASLREAGFQIAELRYLNSAGVAAWFLAGRVLRRTTLGRRQVRFYDRWVIPWLRRVESVVRPPIGQSLLAIARKPANTVAGTRR
jgi:SAM-dependent methyltransferase